LPSTSTRSAAEASATTTIGPNSAMTRSRLRETRYSRRRLLMGRQQRWASRLLGIAPPGFRQITVKRGRRWTRDARPAGDPLGGKMKQRCGVEAGDQDAIEHAHGGDEIVLVFRLEQRGNHGVDGGTLHAHVVARAGLISRCRSPIKCLLVAGR